MTSTPAAEALVRWNAFGTLVFAGERGSALVATCQSKADAQRIAREHNTHAALLEYFEAAEAVWAVSEHAACAEEASNALLDEEEAAQRRMERATEAAYIARDTTE